MTDPSTADRFIFNVRMTRKCHSLAPQYLQCLASTSCPSALHSGQAWVETLRLKDCAISTVTIPVGTAIIPKPITMISAARNWPRPVWGEMSP